MTRLRFNLLAGVLAADLTDTDAAGTATEAAFAGTSGLLESMVDTGDTCAVTIDPDGLAPEIVWITGSNPVTMLRAQEGTTAAAWTAGIRWVHGPTVRDFPVHFGGPVAAANTGVEVAPLAMGDDWAALSVGFSGDVFPLGGVGVNAYPSALLTVTTVLNVKVDTAGDFLYLDYDVWAVTPDLHARVSGSDGGLLVVRATEYHTVTLTAAYDLSTDGVMGAAEFSRLVITPIYRGTGTGASLGLSAASDDLKAPVVMAGTLAFVSGVGLFVPA